MVGNPLIEALGPVSSLSENIKDMAYAPEFNHAYLTSLQPLHRISEMAKFKQFYLPPSCAAPFANDVDVLIRDSYMRRNPLEVAVVAERMTKRDLIRAQGGLDDTLRGMITLEGHSGMGKSRLVRMALSRMPQAIQHETYGDIPFRSIQIVWLSADAPVNGSEKGLMLRLLAALDKAAGYTGTVQNYAQTHARLSRDMLIEVFAAAAEEHHLGVLHIDDLHRLSPSKTTLFRTLQFIVQLANAIKCPVIFSGTPAMTKAFGSSLEAIRRMSSGGAYEIERTSEFSKRLLKTAFKYQWTDEISVPSDKAIETLRKLTQGITSVMLLIHIEAQKLALRRGDKLVTPAHYVAVYRSKLRPMHAALNLLRRSQPDDGTSFEDKFPRNSDGSNMLSFD
jgi:type II secretory pathway predicted ATPase ExeA